ncbi:hypothetical protein [Allosalinactinospora lopnorensis]|uniref:hypothetical protein n=1 Tax=Allosalinactinospora lopnorensis TaxID=1352348 RepID=UPI000623E142|nr:hypothetical protein [Allosalinactinospora lopnorensis]
MEILLARNPNVDAGPEWALHAEVPGREPLYKEWDGGADEAGERARKAGVEITGEWEEHGYLTWIAPAATTSQGDTRR